MGALVLLPEVIISAASLLSNIIFFGLGSAGANITNHMKFKGFKGSCTSINWRLNGQIHMEESTTSITNTHWSLSNETPVVKKPANSRYHECRIVKQRFLCIVCGLGAFTGGKIIFFVVNFLKTNNKNCVAICTLPHSGDGRFRNH